MEPALREAGQALHFLTKCEGHGFECGGAGPRNNECAVNCRVYRITGLPGPIPPWRDC
jgi:hypothetical protein